MGYFSGRFRKIKEERDVFSGEKGSGRLRKRKEEPEVFSGEGFPSEGERGERDIIQGD